MDLSSVLCLQFNLSYEYSQIVSNDCAVFSLLNFIYIKKLTRFYTYVVPSSMFNVMPIIEIQHLLFSVTNDNIDER